MKKMKLDSSITSQCLINRWGTVIVGTILTLNVQNYHHTLEKRDISSKPPYPHSNTRNSQFIKSNKLKTHKKLRLKLRVEIPKHIVSKMINISESNHLLTPHVHVFFSSFWFLFYICNLIHVRWISLIKAQNTLLHRFSKENMNFK